MMKKNENLVIYCLPDVATVKKMKISVNFEMEDIIEEFYDEFPIFAKENIEIPLDIFYLFLLIRKYAVEMEFDYYDYTVSWISLNNPIILPKDIDKETLGKSYYIDYSL